MTVFNTFNELMNVNASIALEIERSEAHIGRCFTAGEKSAFEVAYLAGYATAMGFASRQTAEVLGDVKALEQAVKQQEAIKDL